VQKRPIRLQQIPLLTPRGHRAETPSPLPLVRTLLIVALSAGLLTACGGGGSSVGNEPLPGSESPFSPNPGAIPAPDDDASEPSEIGEPEISIVAVRADGVDVLIRWPEGRAGSYSYTTTMTDSDGWSITGESTQSELLLTDVPVDGEFRFCVSAGGAQSSCTDFTTVREGSDESAIPATPSAPGTPQFTIETALPGGADVTVSWSAPSSGEVVRYRYRGGVNEGSRWSVDAEVEQTQALLRAVPLNGQYWVCVSAANSAGEFGPERCNTLVTPAVADGTGEDPLSGPPINECANAKPEWIWCDDFEQDRLASYFESSMERRGGAGRGGSNAVVGRYLIGTSEAGNLKLAFGRTPSASFRPVDGGTQNYREVYWRVYLRHQDNWQGGGADKLSRATVFTGANWQQAMIAHIWSGADPGPRQNYLMLDPASGVSGSTVVTTRYNDFANLRWLGVSQGHIPLFEAHRRSTWQCVEARVRLNDAGSSNGIFQLWIDGELDVSRTNLNWVGSYTGYGINAIFLENYWNAGSPVEQERYMDNFVVSTKRIGCG
jgi:hypothetical protein